MFGKRIVELRKKQGLTQAELAQSIGISRSALSLYEIEKREPDIETLNKLASLFMVPVGYILGNDLAPNESTLSNFHKKNEDYHFFFFFDKNSLLRNIFAKRLKTAIKDKGLTEDEFKERISLESEKVTLFLDGNGEPTADDLIELSQSLDTSIDYLLGQVPKVSNTEKKMLNAFVKLNIDNQDILIGKAKEMIKEQETGSVAADSSLKKTGTDDPKK